MHIQISSKRILSRRDWLKLSLTGAAALAAACSPIRRLTQPATESAAPDGKTAVRPTALPLRTESSDAPQPAAEQPETSGFAAPPVPLEVIVANRMGFGPRPGDLDEFRSRTGSDRDKLAAYVEEQLHPDEIEDGWCDEKLASADLVSLDKSLQDCWLDHNVNNPYDDSDDLHWQWLIRPASDAEQAAFIRAVFSRRQLYEVLVHFWHNHFNVYGWRDEVATVFMHYDRDVIRPNALGNFGEMLAAVAASPAMLYYLDNAYSQAAGPNENYARELFELHTLGAMNYLGVQDPREVEGYWDGASAGYVDNDVYEAARCFTGWRVSDNDEEDGVGNNGEFLYYRPWHDRFNKIVLGRYLTHDQDDQKDGWDVLDILAHHPGTARFIATKLCRRLIGDPPPDAIIERAAQVFMEQADAPDQIASVVREILLSDEFAATWGQKIKRPFEAAASALRALDLDFTRLNGDFIWFYGLAGQPLFGRHSPDGYSDKKEAWANSRTLLHSWRALRSLVNGWFSEDDSGLWPDLLAQTPTEIRLAGDLVEHWFTRLTGQPLQDEETRSALIDLLTDGGSAGTEMSDDELSWRLYPLVEVILMSPEFYWM